MTMETMDTIEQPQELPEAAELKPKGPSHAKEMLGCFTDNGGIYDVVVKPMLQPGHEGELCSWLKDASLIRSNMKCPTESCNGKSLTWAAARSIDKYSWLCSECKKRTPLREGSFFLPIKCDLKLCMQLIIAWCQSISIEAVVSYLGIKHFIVKRAFEKLGNVAEVYVRNHKNDWILGGPNKILLIDEFPGGYMTESMVNPPVTKKRTNPILCMAEVDKIPPRMWMHIINANPEPASSKNAKNPQPEIKCGMVEEALKEICAHVKPGSYLIANTKARCCSYESLKELTDYKVISLENLQMYDTPGKNELLSNIETIWQTGTGICEDVQETTRANGPQCLYVHLWRQRFAMTPKLAFQHIIEHIAECFPFT